MMERAAKLLEVELACHAIAVAHGHLQEATHVLIDLSHIFFRGKSFLYAAFERGHTVVVKEQHGMCR